MPVLLAILGVLGAAAYWIFRARNAVDAGREVLDVANDVRLAARRFGFMRTHNRHPVEDIDDPNIAIGGIAVSFLELDDYPTQEQRNAMLRALQSELKISLGDAEELTVLGRWLMSECNGPEPAITRMSRKLFKMGGGGQFAPTLSVLKEMLAARDGGMNANQQSALEDIKTAFKIR